jgi:uncharacterized protein YjdB
MDIGYLIQLLNNRLNSLNLAKDQAFMSGDLERINSVDAEILGVKDTLAKLKLTLELSNAANSVNVTPSEVVANGIEATKNIVAEVSASGSDNDGPLSKYNLSTYATDPLYQQKIDDILSVMPSVDTVEKLDAYIDSEAIGSPLTGQMILEAARQYNVDIRLLVAMLELESRFGTAGVAVSTLNPGNVGNTGTATKTFPSWTDGVIAVASWLNAHRVVSQQAASQPVIVAPVLASVVVSPTTINILTDSTQQLSVYVKDQNGNSFYGANIEFSSNDTDVAEVGSNGLVKAISAGNAIITVKATSGNTTVSGTSNVIVIEETKKIVNNAVLTGVVISPVNISITIGSTQQLSVYAQDQNGLVFSNAEISFVSDNLSVATVDSNGLVIAVSAGTANISVRALSEGTTVSASMSVAVTAPVVIPVLANLTLAPQSASISAGATQQLTVNATDQNGKVFLGAVLVFSSNNNEVATVDSNGLVTAVSAGTANITAQASAGSATVLVVATITVIALVPVSLNIVPTSVNIIVGSTQQLTVSISDQNGNAFNGAAVEFSSDNTDVATVDSNGLVTAVSEGSAVVTIKAISGDTTISGSSSITINASQ